MKKPNSEHWRVSHLRAWLALGLVGEVVAVGCLTLLCAIAEAWDEWPGMLWDASLLVWLVVAICWWIGEGEE